MRRGPLWEGHLWSGTSGAAVGRTARRPGSGDSGESLLEGRGQGRLGADHPCRVEATRKWKEVWPAVGWEVTAVCGLRVAARPPLASLRLWRVVLGLVPLTPAQNVTPLAWRPRRHVRAAVTSSGRPAPHPLSSRVPSLGLPRRRSPGTPVLGLLLSGQPGAPGAVCGRRAGQAPRGR